MKFTLSTTHVLPRARRQVAHLRRWRRTGWLMLGMWLLVALAFVAVLAAGWIADAHVRAMLAGATGALVGLSLWSVYHLGYRTGEGKQLADAVAHLDRDALKETQRRA